MEDDHACFTAQQGPGKKHRGWQATMAALPIGKSSGSIPAPSVHPIFLYVSGGQSKGRISDGVPSIERGEATPNAVRCLGLQSPSPAGTHGDLSRKE